jgi:malate synthase
MVQLVKDVFDEQMPTPNQLHRKREDINVTAEDLVRLPEGKITEEGLRTNINVGIQYTAAWLSGRGAVPINDLMEDAATAEISRAQVWQWIRYPKGVLADGRKVTAELFDTILKEELAKLEVQFGAASYQQGNFEEAARIFDQLIKNDSFAEFLTLPAYEQLTEGGKEQ